jgi:DNA-binding XRE family transcriptional regulator
MPIAARAAAHAIGDHRALLARAAIRAARHLGMRNVELARVLGVSEAVISKIDRHGDALPNDAKKLELATLFIRLFRSVDAIVGGDETVAASWLRNENAAFGGKPIDAIQSITGLVDVVAYLDARRALV